MPDLDKLGALARACEAVSPSPWRVDANDCVRAAHNMIPANFDDPPDGEYIAAMDPATTLALLAEVKRLRVLVKDAFWEGFGPVGPATPEQWMINRWEKSNVKKAMGNTDGH